MQNTEKACKNAQRFAQMSEEEVCQEALRMAGEILSFRALSVAMLRQKMLEKGMQEAPVAYAIAYLCERNLLDDITYAESVVRSHTRKGYGAMRIQQTLQQRGVSRADIQQVLLDYQPNWDSMLALLEKRLGGDLSDRKTVDKAAAALARRGFGWSEIRQAMERYREDQIDK